MKIVLVNTVSGVGSVGRICVDLYETMEKNGHEPYIAVGRSVLPSDIRGFKIGNKWDFGCHVLRNFFQGGSGFGSAGVTKKLITWLKDVQPDVIHLHNIHGFYLQTEDLFAYLKKSDTAVVWTLHDCWPFTGHCAYFDYVGCDKWRDGGCHDCAVHAKVYPYALFKDNTKWNYNAKKNAYTGVKNLTIVTPSHWLAELVKNSFLKEYPVEVIPNGINLDVFCPDESEKPDQSEAAGKPEATEVNRKEYNILGVANRWEARKGLDYFEKLAKQLPKEYKITLVGVDRRQAKRLTRDYAEGKITPIMRTESTAQLAQLYRNADVYVNATLEDNFPTTNLEALACGTPVVTFATGGSGESLTEKSGLVVPKGDENALRAAIVDVCETGRFKKEDCRQRALCFERGDRYAQYIALYQRVAKQKMS
ncbi:MAG: glycosyltransferase [Lachnospiraceae bacterium]|nr:glycosyltransferase [Lachnospiraceae bacterium]